jgi:hypothetical protein
VDLVAMFNENVALTGGGSIVVTNLDGGSGLTIDLSGALPDGDGNNVTVSSSNLTIALGNDLGFGMNYAVQISADAIEDLASPPNAFSGITDNTTWNFTVATIPTYTWIQGGVATQWDDPDNWEGGVVPPPAEAGAHLVFSASTSGNVGTDPGSAKVTVGAVSWSSTFNMRSFGTFSNNDTGWIIDTGSTDPATFTVANGRVMDNYYVCWTLISDLLLTGSGELRIQSANRVQGTGGFIVGSNTTLRFLYTSLGLDYPYTGGVTVRDGGIAVIGDSRGSNEQFGEGLLTIEEGGQLQPVSKPLDNNVLIVLTSDGAYPAANTTFITGSPTISGQFSFDLSAVSPTAHNQWQIVSATAVYDAAFSVAGFTESNGVWERVVSGLVYRFDEDTGMLTATTPPGTVYRFR